MNPLLIEVPDHVRTERLILRCPRPGDGAALNAAVVESLRPYMPWAQDAPTLEESAAECRRAQARFLLRDDLTMLMFERNGDDGGDGQGGACVEGKLVGGTGLHRIDWAVRRFEIGYWCRTSHLGRGFVTEAVRGLSTLAFERLQARRVEIRMDPRNERSWRVAERAGFMLEGVLRQDSLTPQGEPRDTRVYARVRGTG